MQAESEMYDKSEALKPIRPLVTQLADDDAVVREKSRERLIHLGGHEVTRALVVALIDPRTHVRWEAAKALQAIADPVSAPALTLALEDENEDVRWVAAEGLIALNKVGLLSVFDGLIKRAGSIPFCKSAHHVLREIQGYERVVATVREALEQSDCAGAVPRAAYQALVALRTAD